MTAKEFLKQYEKAVKKAERYKEEYKDESALIDAIRSLSNNDGMPHGSNISKPTEDKAVRLADKALQWKMAQLDAVEVRQQVFEMIDGISGIEGDVLFQRYIKLRKWEEICVLLHYSWNGVHKAHYRALAIVDKKINSV